MKKIRVFIDYPVSESDDYQGLSVPQVLHDYFKNDTRFELVYDWKSSNIDAMIVFNGGSHFPRTELRQQVFLNRIANKLRWAKGGVTLLANLCVGSKSLLAPHTAYEQRVEKIIARNPNIKIVHRLDDRYTALCKVYGCDKTVFNINQKAAATIHQSDYCQQIWEEGIDTIFGFQKGFKTINPVRIDNGVDTSVFKPSGNRLELKGKHRIIHVSASPMPRKGLGMVLEFAEMLKDNPDIQFYLMGRQPEDPLHGHLISRYKNVHHIPFSPNREDLATTMRSCHVLLFPSVNDCSPNTVLEAMACGLPVVALKSGGVAEMLEYNGIKGGEFINRSNPVFALKTVLDFLPDYSKNAQQIIQQRYTQSIMGKACADLVAKLVVGADSAAEQ